MAQINKPSDYFRVKIYAGDGNQNRAITWDESSNMKPDWLWFKNRSATQSHCIFDSTRGPLQRLITNSSGGQNTENTNLDSFDTNGFTVDHEAIINGNGANYVTWGWKANGGTTASNSSGTITSTVQANTTAGFSIVTYQGTGSNATVGHGLGVAPDAVIIKCTNDSQNWRVYHKGMDATAPEDYALILNNTTTRDNDNTAFNDTAPTSTTFSIGTSATINQNGNTHVAYCFAEKKGYSKFGSYIGNGNTDGPFIYTGFRPAFVIQRQADGDRDWTMMDTKRAPFNVMDERLVPNDSAAEVTNNDTDFVSNGFKCRRDQTNTNGNTFRYIYWAFAESPLVGTNNVPTVAR